MKKDLQYIREKISSIQYGILKMKSDEGYKAWQVKTAPNDEEQLHCIVTDDRSTEQMMNRNVNLVQKHNNDYLYITGRVSGEADQKTKIVSIDILKACWFERRSKGKVSWLKQKYLYENFPADMELAG